MAPPKTTLDKIVVAVTTLADPTGSSRQAIVKFLKSEFQLDNANAIKKALKATKASTLNRESRPSRA